jgi:C_GCAxxG_C_C family probable redox protein
MSTKLQQSLAEFDKGCNCCQSVLSVYAEEFGLDRDIAMKLSSGLGGGMGRMGEICGVVSAAFMVIGLNFGSAEPGQSQERKHTFELAGKFAKSFKARNNSITCRELLGFDMSTAEGKEAAEKPGSFDICPKIMEDAIEILEEILNVT